MQIQEQLTSVVQQLPIMAAQHQSKFIPLDALFTIDDVALEDKHAQIDMDEMKTLGFQVMDASDYAVQRDSTVKKTFGNVAYNEKISQRVQMDVCSEGTEQGSKQASAHGTLVKPKGPNYEIKLVFREEDPIARQLQEMDKKFYEYQERQLKTVSVQMTPQQVMKVQLHKLYQIALDFQKARVKDLMSNVLRQMLISVERRSLIEQYLKKSNTLDLTTVSESKVEMMFNNWAPDLDEVPISMRNNVTRLCRPKLFKANQKVLDFDDKQQDMYLVIEGTSVLFQNKYSYQKFLKQIDQAKGQQKEKSALLSQPNFSHVVQVGTILLKFVQQKELIQQFIARGKRRLAAQDFEAKLYNDGDIGFIKLVPGSTFGDFSETKGKGYKNQCVLVMSENFKCLTITNQDLQALFRKSLSQENMRLIRGSISQQLLSKTIIKRMARCFSERDFPAGSYIMRENQPARSIFILKSGTCEVYSSDNPLRKNPKNNEQFFIKMPVTGEQLCLGLNQGSMSKAFNYFPIKTIGPGQWMGEQAFFDNKDVSGVTIKATCPVRVLEIAIEDFAQKMPLEKMNELRQIAVAKKLLRLMRIKQIAETASDLKTGETLHEFHQQAIHALIQMHPHASKRLMNNMSNQFQLEGHIRTARYKDATNIGQIRELPAPSSGRSPTSMMENTQNSFRTVLNQDKGSGGASVRQENNDSELVKELVIEKQTSVMALSPTGVPLGKEMESRQILLDRKIDAIDEAYSGKRPKHMRNAQAAATTQSYQEFLKSEEDRKIAENLNERKKRKLMQLGVQSNNNEMLSLTTVNGRPAGCSFSSNISSVLQQANQSLAFQPSEAQLKEMDSLIETRQVHPILQMRRDAAYKERQLKSKNAPQRQVIRSITFFNAEQAAQARHIEQNERQQVFKLLGSPQASSMSAQAEASLVSMPLAQMSFLNDRSMHDSGSRINKLDRSFPITDSSPGQSKMQNRQRLNPFGAGLDFSMTSSMHSGGASASNKKKISTLQRTNSGGSPVSLGAMHKSDSVQKISMPQAKLYRAQKLSKQQMGMQHQLKHEVRHQLTQSLQFRTGSLNIMGDYQSSGGHGDNQWQKGGSTDVRHSQHTSSIHQMMNQDSSVLGIEPTALFEQEDSSTQMIESSAALQKQNNEPPRRGVTQIKTGKATIGINDTNVEHIRRNSFPSTEESPTVSAGFRLDISRISFMKRASLQAQQADPSPAVVIGEGSEQLPGSQNKNFNEIAEEHRARSRLELEMLKDIKQIAPEMGDSRMNFVQLEKRQHAETTLKESVKHQMHRTGDTRYLEPQNDQVDLHQTYTDNQVMVMQRQHEDSQIRSSSIAQDTQLSSAGQNAFDEYLQQVQQVAEPAIVNDSSQAALNEAQSSARAIGEEESIQRKLQATHTEIPDVVSDEDQVAQVAQVEESESSSSHGASILLAMEQVESLEISNRGTVPVNVEDRKAVTTSNIAVLNELLSKHHQTRFKAKDLPNQVKAFKTGTFKIKNLQTIDTVPVYQTAAHKLISMRDKSPRLQNLAQMKYGSLQPLQVLLKTQSQIRTSMPATNTRYSQKSDYQDNGGLERISSSLEGVQARGLTISQVNLGPKPLQKTKLSTHLSHKQKRGSQDSSDNHGMVPSNSMADQSSPKEPDGESKNSSRFEKVKLKFNKIATKKLNLTKKQQQQNLNLNGDRNSVKHSQSGTTSLHGADLENVMETGDTNFKMKQRVFGVKHQKTMMDRAKKDESSPLIRRNMYKLSVSKIMHNTLQAEDSALLLPSISIEEDNTKPGGTASSKKEKVVEHTFDKTDNNDATESHDTRYEENQTLTAHEPQGNNADNSGEGSRHRDESGDLLTLPSVNVRLVAHEDNSHDAKEMKIKEKYRTRELSPSSSPMAISTVTKIKIAIEKTASKSPELYKVSTRERRQISDASRYLKKTRRGDGGSGLKNWVKKRALELGARSRSPEIIEKLQFETEPPHEHQNYATIDTSPLSRRSQQKMQKSKPNVDTKHASVQVERSGSLVKECDQTGLHPSDFSSINKSSIPPPAIPSLQSEVHAQVVYESMNMPVIVDTNQRTVMSQEGHPNQANQKPITGKSDYYAPRYKHMPVLIYNKAKHGSYRKVPGQADVDTPPQTRHQQLHAQMLMQNKNVVLGSFNSATAIRGEPAYVKQQKWTINGKKLLEDFSDTKVGSYTLLNEQKARGQDLRRSLVVQEAATMRQSDENPATMVVHTKTHQLIDKLPALPERQSLRHLSLSNVLQRPSQNQIDYVSQHSLESSQMRVLNSQHQTTQQHQQDNGGESPSNYGSQQLLLKENWSRILIGNSSATLGGVGNYGLAGSNPADLTRAKFQRIKEEKLRLQQK